MYSTIMIHFKCGRAWKYYRIVLVLSICILVGKSLNRPLPRVGDDIAQLSPQKYKFRVLCTTTEARRLKWGSYMYRCGDFKKFCSIFFPQVVVDTVVFKDAVGPYNATLFCKSVIPNLDPNMYGKIVVDVIDELNLLPAMIPAQYQVLVQNRHHGLMFPNHTTAIVPHWFNSYPADVYRSPLEAPPLIKGEQILRVGTIWNPGPLVQKGCRTLDGRGNSTKIGNVTYDCIEEEIAISQWFPKYDCNHTNTTLMLQDPFLGSGYLYHTLFRQYHVLVAYPKPGMKMDINSVQRVVSQMRSGVPVLVDCRGKSHGDLCADYQYPCVFTDQSTFEVAIEHMKDPLIRRDCQHRGLEISKDYTPKKIVGIYLKALGLSI